MRMAPRAIMFLMMLSAPICVASDFIVMINGVSKEIDLDEETSLVLPDGTALTLILRQKEYLRFESEMFSFEHRNQYKPNRTDLGDGILQTAIASPSGTAMLVQEYDQMNSVLLVDIMLKELTKEEVEYGYKYSEAPIEKEIDGVLFRGKRAVTSYRQAEWTRIVLGYGVKDRGILVVTAIEKDRPEEDKELIDHLLKTMRVKLKRP